MKRTAAVEPRRVLLARATQACTAIAIFFAIVNALQGGPGSNDAALLCLLFAALTGVTAWCYLNPKLENYLPVVYFNAVLNACLVLGIAWFDGGSTSLLFAYIYALPLCYGVLIPYQPLIGPVSAGALAVTGTALLVAEGALAERLAHHLALLGASGFISLFGTRIYRGLDELEREVERERAETAERLAQSERERRETAEQLAESERERHALERLAVIGRLGAGVGHEINNPLAFVKANVQWMREEYASGSFGPPCAELEEVLRDTNSGLVRIQRIVADLRNLSQANIACGPVDPSLALREAVKNVSSRLEGIELMAELSDTPVFAEESRLVQVFTNLLSNSADALEERTVRRIRIRSSEREGRVTIAFEDSGPGVASEIRQRIFEPFSTTKEPGRGVGLGLALSREYVAQFGGSFGVGESDLGGAAFFIELGAAEAWPAKPGASAARAA